jgi:LPXTG-motif cell wall-anchored protein
MSTSPVATPRTLAGFAVVLAVAGSVFLASPAYAHHPEVVGSADCASVITFTSTAWSAPTTPERSNSKIQISYSTGGAYVVLADDPAYRYDASNAFVFSNTFAAPAGWTSLTVRATALGAWGDGAGPGYTRTSTAITPKADCTPTTTAPLPVVSSPAVPVPVVTIPVAAPSVGGGEGATTGAPAAGSPQGVAPAGAALVAPPASGMQAQVASSELPRTGVSAVGLFVIGSIAVVLGGGVVLVTRRP